MLCAAMNELLLPHRLALFIRSAGNIFPLFALLFAEHFAHAQIQTAGTLFVNVDATARPLGSINLITNTGSLGGLFEARGGGVNAPRIAMAGSSGARGIQFDGDDYMQHVTAAGGALILPPSGLVGIDPTRSIEVWAFNPAIADEETLLSWGH